MKWRSNTTRITSTSSTFSELEGAYFGGTDFLPIWEMTCKTLGCHVEAVVLLDNQSTIKIIKMGYSKGLLWTIGIDRATTHILTAKSKVLKLQVIHELFGPITEHIPSRLMRADCLTKQIESKDFARHLKDSFQLIPVDDVTMIRCSCLRCRGSVIFSKTRCENLIKKEDGPFCTECSQTCKGLSADYAISPRAGFPECKCNCRGLLIEPAL